MIEIDEIQRNPIELKQLNEHIWLMNDNNEATGYIVVGEKIAAIIDTMNGFDDVKAVARKVTDLPLMVINTHGHGDHIFGNVYFDEAYIHPKEMDVVKWACEFPEFKEALKKYNMKMAEFIMVNEGDTFDLGGITLEIYLVPGHTSGGICILDKQDRVLFTGDTINRHTWMQLDGCLSMSEFYENLDRLKVIRSEFDYILHGHAQGFEPASLYEEHMEAVREVRDGVNDGDSEYEYFGGKCMQHQFPINKGQIVYNNK